MYPRAAGQTYICARCASKLERVAATRPSSQLHAFESERKVNTRRHASSKTENLEEENSGEKGAMSQRLAEMSEESLEGPGGVRAAQKTVEESGFSEELKEKLLAKIQDGKFRQENTAAFAEVNMPSGAGQGTRQNAAAQPWTGTESTHDTALRMLDDAHKPLRASNRGSSRISIPRGGPPPGPVSLDMRMKQAISRNKGQRLANARDRTSIYALSQDPTMTEREREQMRKQLKERFTPAARPMPGTIQGLAALANERIEDAIARGQFKNIPRGKGKNIERDYNASSPFLDTTEYFMNKIIQKQEIVPPWIEKQQELVKAAALFRSRLRQDWKRHAARTIASKGGSLEQQVRRAKAYAAAEERENPRVGKVKTLSEIAADGRVANLVVEEKTPGKESVGDGADPETTIRVTLDPTSTKSAPDADVASNEPDVPLTEAGQKHSDTGTQPSISITVTSTITASPPEPTSDPTPSDPPSTSTTPNPPPSTFITPSTSHSPTPATAAPPLPTIAPFRDPAWESLERNYLTLSVSNLNNLARSYNLQAPSLAKKPYFNLERELRACYADVAPQLADEIFQRATAPKRKNAWDDADGGAVGRRVRGVLEGFGGGEGRVRVYDSRRPHYGFREFWRELFGKGREEQVGKG
ncbi:hypothetical protein MMC25_005881 [Agyrium rufum]|nr:hypothetical protein [Agyrium rufum]